MRQYVAYYRVSTEKQGFGGLGMESQRNDISRFLNRDDGQLLSVFVEVESAKKHKNRPQLIAALKECEKRKATLLIARLDRLARNVAFISSLMESGVEFMAVDMPQASRLTIHILAAVAEHEREMTSKRTKAALAAAKARGIKLGNPRYAEALEKARAAIHTVPVSEQILDMIFEMRISGSPLREIADRLNELNIRSALDRRWHASTVRNALNRHYPGDKARLRGYPIDRNPDSQKSRDDDNRISCRPPSSLLNRLDTGAKPSCATRRAGRRVTHDGEMTMAELAEAYRMLDTFASVGATNFDVTFTDIDGEKCGFRKEQTARQLRNSLEHLFPGLTERKQNLIVRPSGDSVRFVQLDDLSYEQLTPLSPVSCLIIETSPGNHQAWVALSDLENSEAKDFARRLRKGIGADPTASGATRCAGTANYKRKYEPTFPEVKIMQAAPGRLATKSQLEALGLLAAPEPVYDAPVSPFRVSSGRNWPDYQRCVQGAPKNAEKKPDISRADFFWALMAAQRHFTTEEIAGRLMELSSKARENGPHYAELTAQNAVAASERQRRSRV